ncbi:MAG: methyltransferase domain-containing protein [Polyangiales bacterium]
MTQIEAQTADRRKVSYHLDSPELAAAYDKVGVRQFEHGKVLIAALAPQPGERVLDVGCGTGLLGGYVAGLVAPAGEVVGVDPLPLRIEIAGTKHPRFSASVGTAEDLSRFPDASFDVAYLNSVFHWVADKPRALRELLRVLKPGGRLGVNSADGDRAHQSASLVRDVVNELGFGEAAAASGFGTNYRVNGVELATLLHDAGFVGVKVDPHTFVDSVTGSDDLITWSTSSSFGNFLSDLDEAKTARVRQRIEEKLAAKKQHGAVELERYLVFATARKP